MASHSAHRSTQTPPIAAFLLKRLRDYTPATGYWRPLPGVPCSASKL
ncbi:MAG: hypothetical protein JO263_10890 [Candidatus Eremiobacteraeota bacterium]|nr:hypothetical protein [Candidatus Eremiobacteraeota bacterium]